MPQFVTIIVCSLIVIGTFLFWEFVAWFTHKYIMHGFLWTWHKSHHTAHNAAVERNDLFAVIFSLPAVALFYYFSLVTYSPYGIAVGVGISCYGLFYLIFHDIIVHQRIRWRPQWRSKYLQRMINAHYVHHSKHTRENCEAFGFLFAPRRYEPKQFEFKKERQQTQ
jgi:beta-carotene 3-hydroxylase